MPLNLIRSENQLSVTLVVQCPMEARAPITGLSTQLVRELQELKEGEVGTDAGLAAAFYQ